MRFRGGDCAALCRVRRVSATVFGMPDQSTATPVWEEPPRGAPGDLSALIKMSGLEALQTFLDGRSPAPPVARLTGRRIVSAERGRVVYELPVSEWLVGPKGTTHPGVLAFLADAPLLATIQSVLGPGTVCTTAEVSTTFLGTASKGDLLLAEGKVIHADGSTGLSEVFIRRGDHTLIAHGTSRLFIFPPVRQEGEVPPLKPLEAEDHDVPDPYLRPAEGGTLAPEALGASSGLELLQKLRSGELPRSPVDNLTGIRLVEAEDGRVAFAMPATGWCSNELGTVFGGMVALLASSAGSAAVQSTAPVGTKFTALDMKLNLLRPLFADGRELTATGTVTHRGRQLSISSTEVTNEDGKVVAIATGTTMLSKPD
jgi:uncharacterized protein (TIGR00369 family)